MAAMRSGVTHWQAGEIEIGHGMVCRAYAILMVTHGSMHPITKDLEVNTVKPHNPYTKLHFDVVSWSLAPLKCY